ncbi:MAG TPA: magnesium-translocating P-type ATPase [Candidatus Limnocylindrales bacterium]|nr:magnesium-translocating P-type ATPase [Candidatus Limnocylindrales bacterium]
MTAPPSSTGGAAYWAQPAAGAEGSLGSGPDGLGSAEAAKRLASRQAAGLGGTRRTSDLALLARQFESPIILILVVATILSGVLGDATDAVIILAIIALSGLLGYWQERGANRAVAALLAVVQVQVDVRRDGHDTKVPIDEVVPGDVVLLNAGDVMPGDGLVLESGALLVDESALTGESFPVEKSPGVVDAATPVAKRTNCVFLGTHVVSGSGTALIARTGADTEFGGISAQLKARQAPTGFEQGMTAFGYLLLRVMIVLVATIFVVNVLLARPLLDSALFSLALAVGLTPQLLPAIVTISLSAGARLMARRKVIVKRLDAIEDFGAMTILCTDKTGTMTAGEIVLHDATDPAGAPSAEVRRLAFLNASLQRGFSNPIDAAIVAARNGTSDAGGAVDGNAAAGPAPASTATRIAELPYDFTRRRLSVLVDDGGRRTLITKGALADVLAVCTAVGSGDGPIATAQAAVQARFQDLSAQGYRVLGLATKAMPEATAISVADEAGMTLVGLLTFLDPPKADAAGTIADLAASGISIRMITGDNRLVAAHVAGLVGLDGRNVLAGPDVDAATDPELAAKAAGVSVFAEIQPLQKERIIRALRAGGSVVGYMGDGINDAPALHAADVGISVDTAVDVAKESAAIVLLDKSLQVLLDGVHEGRRTFANTMKYVRVNTSASFGNVLSMAIASVVLPFLPLLPAQILLINFLTDLPATTIATDSVDPEQLATPRNWNIDFVRDFMIVFGVISTLFDIVTFVTLRLGFNAGESLFQSGWFVESVATELAVLFVLRTRRPFFRSGPSRLLVLSSVALAIVTIVLPYSPVAGLLGLEPIALPLLLALLGITLLYVVVTDLAKSRFFTGTRANA